MPRRVKPPGYERWTWAEIDAGRRMSKAEKRWNRVAKNLDWDRRPDGSYQAPPNAVPFLVIIAVLMVVLCVLAPEGLNNARGDAGALAVLVYLAIAVMMVLLVIFGQNNPPAIARQSVKVDPVPLTGGLPRSATARDLSGIGIGPRRPILMPALCGLARAIGAFLSFRWVYRLPDWLQPIVWPLIVGAALAPAVARWSADSPRFADLAVCLTFVVAGCALGGLVHDGLESRRERRRRDEAEREEIREQFRKVLARELVTRPVRDFNFAELVAEHATPRFEADAAAAMVYRRFSDQVVADGFITAAERRRLVKLARMLEIDAERVVVIERAAKADRFRMALDEVLADGVVTEDEAREIEDLRASLGVSDTEWAEGQGRIDAVTQQLDLRGSGAS